MKAKWQSKLQQQSSPSVRKHTDRSTTSQYHAYSIMKKLKLSEINQPTSVLAVEMAKRNQDRSSVDLVQYLNMFPATTLSSNRVSLDVHNSVMLPR